MDCSTFIDSTMDLTTSIIIGSCLHFIKDNNTFDYPRGRARSVFTYMYEVFLGKVVFFTYKLRERDQFEKKWDIEREQGRQKEEKERGDQIRTSSTIKTLQLRLEILGVILCSIMMGVVNIAMVVQSVEAIINNSVSFFSFFIFYIYCRTIMKCCSYYILSTVTMNKDFYYLSPTMAMIMTTFSTVTSTIPQKITIIKHHQLGLWLDISYQV